MSKNLEKRVLDLEISNAVSGLKWAAFWVLVALWFVVMNVMSSQWIFVIIWAVVGGLHVHAGVQKWQTYKALNEERDR